MKKIAVVFTLLLLTQSMCISAKQKTQKRVNHHHYHRHHRSYRHHHASVGQPLVDNKNPVMNEQQAAASAQYVYSQLKQKNVAIIFDKSIPAVANTAAKFADVFVQQGGTISFVRAFSHKKVTLSAENVNSLPKVIFLSAGVSEAPSIVNQLKALRVHSTIIGFTKTT